MYQLTGCWPPESPSTLQFSEEDVSIPVLEFDPQKIEQVLNNFISNAIKFSYPNTTVWITITKGVITLFCLFETKGKVR
jgi:signal transduction histidine kinase